MAVSVCQECVKTCLWGCHFSSHQLYIFWFLQMRKITIFKIQTTVVQLFYLFQCVAYFPCKVSESKCLQRCGPQVSTLFYNSNIAKRDAFMFLYSFFWIQKIQLQIIAIPWYTLPVWGKKKLKRRRRKEFYLAKCAKPTENCIQLQDPRFFTSLIIQDMVHKHASENGHWVPQRHII